MVKVAQVLSKLNENLFDFLDFVVKKFYGSSLAFRAGSVIPVSLCVTPPLAAHSVVKFLSV
jgi:hypothetical protein